MTDVPPDSDAPGAPPVQPWDPSGIRRSNFTPAPPDAEPPTFDDDALADAMAAEVSPYTSEIKLPHLLPPEGAEFGGPAPEAVAEPLLEPEPAPVAPVPVTPIPLVEPARFLDSGFPVDTAPLSAATGVSPTPAGSSPEEEELRRALGGASTLEAMDRLEDEFRRLSNGEAPSLEFPATTGEAPATAVEPTRADSVSRVNTDVFSWLSATTVASTPEVPEMPSVDAAASEAGPSAASVFDIPGADAWTPAAQAEPADVADDTVTTQIATSDPAEPTASAEPTEPAEPAVDPLEALAFGGAWALPEPEAETSETESAPLRPLSPVPPGPLPGTDALGWNRTSPIPDAPASEAIEPDAASETLEPEPEPALDPTAAVAVSEPLASPLGTEVWSLFPDDDVVTPTSGPEQSAFDLPAPSAVIADPSDGDAAAAGHADAGDAPADETEPVGAAPADPHPEPAAFAWMFPASTADVAPIDEPSFPLPDPGSQGPDGAPVAFESLATAAVPIVVPVLPTPDAPTVEPASVVEPAPAPESPPAPSPEFSSFPGLPPVDESLIDPDAAAEAALATLAASIPLSPAASESSPTWEAPSSAEPVEPWMIADEAEDGVWDLGGERAPSPNPGIAAAAAAAALVAAGPPPTPVVPLLPPTDAPVPPSTTGPLPVGPAVAPWSAPAPDAGPSVDSIPAPAPTVLSAEVGPPLEFAVPYSIEPPVGPESPDWLDAPPPVYTPPELVEPPQFAEVAPNPALDGVAPITASTMARLPVPPPSELPNIADRAELPPPPGYEDIPILSSDAAAQSAAFAPVLFAPAMSAPLTPSAEPLLPVPPSAPALGEVAPTPSVPEATEPPSLDDEDDDAIDDVDRVGAVSPVPLAVAGAATGVAGGAAVAVAAETVPEAATPLSEPIATVRLDDDQAAIVDEKPKVSALGVESAGVEPTAMDLRTGRAARLFWLWFAANSSVVSLGLGAVLLGTGMSLRQSIVATLAGVAISFLPLGLGTLAGKWSGQPTMVVSRAAFGHAGNILPAALAVITRVFWGGVLLWLLATAVAQILVGAGLDAGLGMQLWQLIALVAGFVIATVVAVFGYGFVARLQLVLSIVNALLIVGAAILTFRHLDFPKALTVPDGSWVLAIGGAAIVFSVIGLAWVHSSSDLARYQRAGVSGSGGASMLWATFGATLPPFLLICWGAMLAASDPALARGLQTNPLAAIAGLLPAWYPVPLLAAAALGLLSGAVLTIYSGGFAVLALGLRLRRSMTTLVSAILVVAAAAALLFLVPDFSAVVRSLIITIAVPVAAWAGIFAAEMMIRTRRFHTASLLTPGGIYPSVRWVNLIGLIVISAISYGFVTSDVVGFGWEGFAFTAMGVSASDPLGASDIGVFIALLLGVLLPLAGGISAIRRQEAVVPGVPGAQAAVIPAAPVVTTAPVVTAAPGPFSAPATPAPAWIPAE